MSKPKLEYTKAQALARVKDDELILKYHYRCVPMIANFCDRLCNYGMIIKTEAKASRLGANLIACNVEGKLENNVNWAEVDAVEALIECPNLRVSRLNPLNTSRFLNYTVRNALSVSDAISTPSKKKVSNR